MAPKKGELLARVNFPLYGVKMLSPRYLLVVGGGGPVRSGISNAMEVYELSYSGTKCVARPACRFDIGDKAAMNCCTWYNGKEHVIWAGLEGNCQMYEAKYKVVREEEADAAAVVNKGNKRKNSQPTNVRRRRTSEQDITAENESRSGQQNSGPSSSKNNSSASDKNSNSYTGVIGFDIKPTKCFQTDFPPKIEDAFQKVVRISGDGKILVTGGSDGHIRIWTKPDFKLSVDIKAHNDDVDDLDVHPSATKIVSVSRDCHAHVWSVKDGKHIGELKWDPSNGQKYRCRNCRFGITENDKTRSKIFTAHVPVSRQNKMSTNCYLVKWDANKLIPEKILNVRQDLSSLAVSDDGRFVATGTISGAISIYIAFSLQRLYHVEHAHSIFVTGLEFLPSSESSTHVVGEQDASLISISVDNQIQIHHIPKPATMHIGLFLFIMIVILVSTFVIMSYMGL